MISGVALIIAAKIWKGLPPYGSMAEAFPAEWGRLGREGLVVEFETHSGRWIANFEPGTGGLRYAGSHPNGRDGVVISEGDLWIVSGEGISAERICSGLNAFYAVTNPDGWLFDRHGLAFVRMSLDGIIWHTRRISWDGFDKIHITDTQITGMAWSPVDDVWCPFAVDLRTGRATGGSFFDEDVEGWEQLYLV